MNETDPDRQYTGDGERENPDSREGRIEPDEETLEFEKEDPRPKDDGRRHRSARS
jgi:hypothetical protein